MSHLVVLTAGMGTPSATALLGERLGRASVDALARNGVPPYELRTVAVREFAADLVNYLLTRVPTARLSDAFATIGTAAGVIAVSPIWNGSYSGLFKTFVDALDEGVLAGRPVLLGATGGSARHSLAIDQAMLPLFFYLKATVAPTSVFAATADWGDAESGLDARIQKAAQEFAVLVEQRPASDHADEFDAVVDFAELLGGGTRPGR